MMDLKEHPHRRYNPLTREWVLVSPHRTKRPWQGQTEAAAAADEPAYDGKCYLCPGNERAGGHRNPEYTGTFVFDNDFAALLPGTPAAEMDEGGLLVAHNEPGVCRVLCFSPHHSMTLAKMTPAQVVPVVEAWTEQYGELLAHPAVNYVQIFENRGEAMGCSNPHPHCQIWSCETLPNEVLKEEGGQAAYRAAHGSCLLCDYLALERRRGERIVYANDSFTVLVPFWAVWPFETLLLPNRHVSGMDGLDGRERSDLAAALGGIGRRYDRLFSVSFPYTMGFHQRPKAGAAGGVMGEGWHLHAHYYPPLLRSATVRKFMVGYEMLGTPQRDITPESAAERLRALE